jgi:streptogramin lyase
VRRRRSGLAGLLAAVVLPVVGSTGPVTAAPASSVHWQIMAPTNWVGDGSGPVAFLNVATDEAGLIYVANFSSVLVYDSQTGALRGAIVDPTRTVLQYDDVAPAGDGNVWVADSKSFNVYLLDSSGAIVRMIPFDPTDQQFEPAHPNELEVGPDGNLYVMYSSAHTVMEVFAPDGALVRAFDMGDTLLSTGLIDFAFGTDGNLYVAGSSTARVLDPEGTLVVERFAPEFLDASNAGVHGIAVDSTGRVYIGGNSTAADGTIAAAVYQFDADGQMLAQFGRAQQRMNWGEPFQPGELAFTVSIAALPDGRLAISDLNGAYSQLLAVTMAA